MTTLDATLAALAEPTRRHAIDLLRERPRRAGELAAALSVSAPLMSRHLRTLRLHGLVEESHADPRDSRVRTYHLRREPFDELRGWLQQVEAFWADQLGAFRSHVEKEREKAQMISEHSVTATTVVRTDPDAAFDIFTQQIDSWWRRGPAYRTGDGAMRFDAERLVEGDTEVARVLAWEPGARLLLEWCAWSFRQGERTQVEVRFEAIGDGTRVTVEHRGWESRGRGAEEFRTVVGLWWATTLGGIGRLG